MHVQVQPHNGRAVGELQVKGPIVVAEYMNLNKPAVRASRCVWGAGAGDHKV